MAMTTAMNDFLREHPEHIAGSGKTPEGAYALDATGTIAFGNWLRDSGRWGELSESVQKQMEEIMRFSQQQVAKADAGFAKLCQ